MWVLLASPDWQDDNAAGPGFGTELAGEGLNRLDRRADHRGEADGGLNARRSAGTLAVVGLGAGVGGLDQIGTLVNLPLLNGRLGRPAAGRAGWPDWPMA